MAKERKPDCRLKSLRGLFEGSLTERQWESKGEGFLNILELDGQLIVPPFYTIPEGMQWRTPVESRMGAVT